MTGEDTPHDTTTAADEPAFRDAEEFLAGLGVERRPIVVRLDPPGDDGPGADGGRPPTLADAAAPLIAEREDGDGRDDRDDRGHDAGAPPVSVTEATRVATETAGATMSDQVGAALSYIRRATGAQPMSEGRVRSRLADRGHDPDVVEAAITAARAERLVDDDALSAAMVAEWRAKGHAPRRIRADLRRRGFDQAVVERAVGTIDAQDHTAMAFTLARRRAETLGHLPPETAYRRVAGYVARRGYGEGLARKAARDAVYDQRSDERTAGR